MTQPTGGEPTPTPLPLDVLYSIFKILGFMIALPGATSAGEIEKLRQLSFYHARSRNLEPGDVGTAYRRGFVGDAEVENVLRRHGFSERATDVFKQLLVREFGGGEYLDLWRRDELDDSTLDSHLSTLGYDAERIEQLKVLAFSEPTPSDVIRFAVREVYTPSLRASLELDSEFPIESVEAFRRSGLNPTVARDYWAAHWQLPAIGHAFEMLHRGFIDESDIDLLLKANDYLPKYRDAYKAIAYNPLTRVDVRRMHALGLIDEDGLTRRYRDVGYSPEDADLLTQFTLAFNEDTDAGQSQEVRELTRAQIETFLAEGLFTEDEALDGLQSIGYTPANAQTIVILTSLRQERRLQDTRVDVIRRQFSNETISYNDAVTALDGIGLPAPKRDLILAQLEAEKQSQIRLPSRAELDRMAKAGLVTQDEYMTQLDHMGYAPQWAEKFWTLVEMGNTE